MNSRLFAIVMFSLFFGLTATAQETKSDEETLFELSYNNYGPCVRLYKKDGKIMKAVEGSGIRDKRINKFLSSAEIDTKKKGVPPLIFIPLLEILTGISCKRFYSTAFFKTGMFLAVVSGE